MSSRRSSKHLKVGTPLFHYVCNLNMKTEDECVFQLPTPKTPRHRDALSKKVPITPRHRIGIFGKALSTPRTPQTPSATTTIYNCARQLFTRSVDPKRLIGRDDERKELQSFLDSSRFSRPGRCIYVSGPPGTGKSALVSEICQGLKRTKGVKTAYINCMSIKTSGDIYSKLATEILDGGVFMDTDAVSVLRSTFLPKQKSGTFTYIVTLDEIDHLLTLDLEALYALFEWSLHQSSKLIVIGIANALDLTDRFLPRLKARNLKPQLLPFLPYTAPQIASIITTKLQSLISYNSTEQSDYIPFVQPAAIQLCSKKVASQTGDLRKAFDIIRRTIDLVETEIKAKDEVSVASQLLPTSPSKSPLAENPNLASPASKRLEISAHSLEGLTPLTAPRATIAHVSRASAAALNNGTFQRIGTLNLQQKAALCALISHQKASRRAKSLILLTPSTKLNNVPTVKALHETYTNLCKRENALHPLTAIEFADIISSLEALGLVGEESGGKGFARPRTPSKKGRPEDRRFMSLVDEKEVQVFFDGVGGNILRGLSLDEGD